MDSIIEINPAVFDFYLFKIGERTTGEIVPSEEIAKDFLKKIDAILGSKSGFYNEFSTQLHWRILQFILMRYPNLNESAFNLQEKFKKQIWTAYFDLVHDGNIKNKFILGGIISDIYRVLDQNICLMEHLQRFYPNDIEITTGVEKYRKTLIDFLGTEIIFLSDDKKIEKMRNYDIVCWYILNFAAQSPQIISHDKDHDTFLNDILELQKNYIKEKYGIS
ncbi:MAG: hypothetical protein NTW33_11905 [Methanoregula sp.]|nr:hypothetical protein [Methanoregula sp.]